jgi:hypothetical protein
MIFKLDCVIQITPMPVLARGGALLGLVPNGVLLPLLAALLVISAVQVWRRE